MSLPFYLFSFFLKYSNHDSNLSKSNLIYFMTLQFDILKYQPTVVDDFFS